MKLVIAEKPMLARDIAKAVCGVKVDDNARLPISGNGYTVVACAGHLLQLISPDQMKEEWGAPWSLDVLPIYIPFWKKEVIKGKETYLDQIKKLLAQADCVIHAGDPDDEGQLIVDEVIEYLGYKGQVMRVYINDNIDKNIKKAFNNLVPNEDCTAVGKAALARQIADYSFGVNESRLASLKCKKKLSVGRVQTPTLGLVVERDRQIENHITTEYFEIFANCDHQGNRISFKLKPNKEILDGEVYILSADKACEIQKGITDLDVEISTKVKREYHTPPLPYNLTVLIADMNKKYKYNASKTLELTQQLRDKFKAITYNRSDSQYLKDEHYISAPQTLSVAMKNINEEWELDFTIKSKAFNDKLTTAHHGIIPQEIELNISEMSTEEANVYTEIVTRYAMQFMPPEMVDVSISTFDTPYGECTYKAKKIIDGGYKKILSVNEDAKEEDFGKTWIPEGEYSAVVTTAETKEKRTSPPKPYTEGTLISDMASISKYVENPEIKKILKEKDSGKKGENGGIGTTATRPSIIDSLKTKGFIEEKSGKIRATSIGREFYDILPDEIKKADTTAKWWLMQSDIAAGDNNINMIQDSVIDIFKNHKDSAYQNVDFANAEAVVGKCPVCGSAVIKIDNPKLSAYKCENKDCEFILWMRQFGSELSAANAAKILLEGRSEAMTFTSKKSGKKFKARLKLKSDKKTVELEFINK